MYYTIYVTINKINSKFYIGMHRTDDLNDSYLGSGILLDKAREKYGDSSFIKLVSLCKDEQEMIDKEESIVTEDFLKEWEGITYNIARGGLGGNILLPESKQFKNMTNNKNNPSLKNKDSKCFITWKENVRNNQPQRKNINDYHFKRWINSVKRNGPQYKSKNSQEYKLWYENRYNSPDKIIREKEIEEILKDLTNRMNANEISNHLNLGLSSVYRWLKYFNLSLTKHK